MSSTAKRRNYRKREVTPEESATDSPSATDAGEGATTKDNEPEGLSLDELLELRKLRQRPAGVTAADLLVGDSTGKKKKKDKVVASDPWSGGGLVDMDEVKRQEEGSGEKSTTRILNSFTKQTNALDVDKHMMKYIEDEMKKRRGEDITSDDKEEQSRGSNIDADILEGLGIKKTAPKPEQEGNVQLSTTMLTAIPEVDLGMEARLRNIEDTEKAKRKLFEQRTTTAINPERFSQPAYVPSDRERASHHRQNKRRNKMIRNNNSDNNNDNYNNNYNNKNQYNDAGAGPNHRFQNTYGNNSGQNERGVDRGMATDDLVMERFKKRMRR